MKVCPLSSSYTNQISQNIGNSHEQGADDAVAQKDVTNAKLTL
jgi:hypothetical protein